MTEESRLRQNFDINERRSRLKRDGSQFFAPVQPIRRVHIDHRHGEQEPPVQGSQPKTRAVPKTGVAAAVYVVAFVDCLQKGIEMLLRPGGVCRRDGNQAQGGSFEPLFERAVQPSTRLRPDHHRFGFPASSACK
jgi:hypothetical protein